MKAGAIVSGAGIFILALGAFWTVWAPLWAEPPEEDKKQEDQSGVELRPLTRQNVDGIEMIRKSLMKKMAADKEKKERREQEEYEFISREMDKGNIPALMLLQKMRPETYRESYMYSLMAEFNRIAGPDRVLEKREAVDGQRIQDAGMRANAFGQFLRFDLDGDGAVVRSEFVAFHETRHPSGRGPRPRQVQHFMRADLDEDGKITLREMFRTVSREAKAKSSGRTGRMQEYLALDPDDDGRLTIEEIRALSGNAFNKMDKDGDGFLSKEEHRSAGQLQAKVRRWSDRKRREQQQAGECNPPRSGKGGAASNRSKQECNSGPD